MVYFLGGIVGYLAGAFVIGCFREQQLDLGMLGLHTMFGVLNGFIQFVIWGK